MYEEQEAANEVESKSAWNIYDRPLLEPVPSFILHLFLVWASLNDATFITLQKKIGSKETSYTEVAATIRGKRDTATFELFKLWDALWYYSSKPLGL